MSNIPPLEPYNPGLPMRVDNCATLIAQAVLWLLVEIPDMSNPNKNAPWSFLTRGYRRIIV